MSDERTQLRSDQTEAGLGKRAGHVDGSKEFGDRPLPLTYLLQAGAGRARDSLVSTQLMMLQKTVGNAALASSSLLRPDVDKAIDTASSERPTSVSNTQEGRIKESAKRIPEVTLDSGAATIPGTRLHADERAQQLASSFDAHAFSYGRDVFLGHERNPRTREGHVTVAHELVHAQSAPVPGQIFREPKARASDVSKLESKVSELERGRKIDNHLHKYFERLRDMSKLLVDVKKGALDRFAQATDAAYNKEAEPSSFAIFSLALNLVPEVAALAGVLKIVGEGGRYFADVAEAAHELEEGSKTLEAVAKVNEAVKGSAELVKGTGEIGEAKEKNRATSDAERRGNFIMGQVNDLLGIEVDSLNEIWKNEDALGTELEPLAANPAVDLDQFLDARLPIPRDVSKDAMQKASYRFELLLYKQMYGDAKKQKKSRKSYLDPAMSGEGTLEEYVDEFDLPEKMLKHIERDIAPAVPGALEIVFGDDYERTPARTREREKREKEQAQEAKDARAAESFEEALLGLTP